MRSKSPVLMNQICKYAEQYYLQNGHSPSTTKIAEAVGISRGTAYKYLVEMADTNAARFHTEFDNERVYTQNELAQMFASVEWQADTMGASLLMPKFIVENALAKFTNSMPIKIYGDTTFAKRDKETIRRMAAYLSVSYTALVIRLRGLGMLEYHDISEFISNELQLGGVQ